MKLIFKKQKFQLDAVDSIVKVFGGQTQESTVKYTRDIGLLKKNQQQSIYEAMNISEDDDTLKFSDGFANNKIFLPDESILENIQNAQRKNGILDVSSQLHKGKSKPIGRCTLDVEMETGTGKTYVYIRSIFELNKLYGFTKFIIVVPSIAIREGVKKSFVAMRSHFFDEYGKKAIEFIYNSKNLDKLDDFSKSAKISVMIINAQAFNARGQDARKIYERQDDFRSRRPIDVIAANRPILILDEPQKLSGAATLESLQNFKPLFCMRFSATHKDIQNMIYRIDALDAYNKKLVKKIEVKGIEVRNLKGNEHYLYLADVVISPKHPPKAKLWIEKNYSYGAKREPISVSVNSNIYTLSNEMEQYKGYVVSDINGKTNEITFTNGITLRKGEVVGDESDIAKRRVQIRETINSHFEKEKVLFDKNIKVLSLFFIDEVAKYRAYDESGQEINSVYGQIFEEEYAVVLKEYLACDNAEYVKYLEAIEVDRTHKGYFSIDKKSNKMIDPSVVKSGDNKGLSDDISAYELILKNKERLLSFDEPTRFIFSHSALREGWDNPNVFQICTLKQSDNKVGKHQEVGRGLRICVNSNGERMDEEKLDREVHKINMLTVVASESYQSFVEDLQTDLKDYIYDRPVKADKAYFEGKPLVIDGVMSKIDEEMAEAIDYYLKVNRYIDKKGQFTEEYRRDKANGKLADFDEEIKPYEEQIVKLFEGVFDPSVLKEMYKNANAESKLKENPLKDNFKQEFKALWNKINKKYAYLVKFDSNDIIKNAIEKIDNELVVKELVYFVQKGTQKVKMNSKQIDSGEAFTRSSFKVEVLNASIGSSVAYDIIGKIAENTELTRKTISNILRGIKKEKFMLYEQNPEDFIIKVSDIINVEKSTTIVKHITYHQIDGSFDDDIFTKSCEGVELSRLTELKRSIQQYAMLDSHVEEDMAKALDDSIEDVSVYAKLPKGFYIPTPVGKYSPDWAISFTQKEGRKDIFFIAENKGKNDSMQLKKMEEAKTSCAKALYTQMSDIKVQYHVVDSYEELMNKVMGIK